MVANARHHPLHRHRRLLPLLVLAALASLAVGLCAGSLETSPVQVLSALLGREDGVVAAVVWELRLPRALSAFVTGGLLALAGVLMQVLLRNPLADPYILGVSGGASVAALTALLLGLGAFWVSAGAFGGAMAAMLLVFVLSHGRGGWSAQRLLLTGVVLAAGWSAVIGFLLSISPAQNLRGMLFWLMGDLAGSGWPGWAALVLASGLAAGIGLARPLNLLIRGEMQARLLGVAVEPVRLALFFLASLLTATAVTVAGSIGFIGLVVPHLLRLVMGSDHRLLLPGAVLAGGALLVLADAAARTLIAPQQLPVGVLVAMLGVPAFLVLLHRGHRGLGSLDR